VRTHVAIIGQGEQTPIVVRQDDDGVSFEPRGALEAVLLLDGEPYDLTGVNITVVLKMRDAAGVVQTLSATLLTPLTEGRVRVILEGIFFAEPGVYDCCFVLTTPDTKLTFPGGRNIRMLVKQAL
jgi:hypothetical protein